MIDPRTSVIPVRLKRIGRTVAFTSSKGGVGKSSTAVVSALLLAKRGHRVGILDFDFHGATDHLFLGVTPSFPEEEGGILPVAVVPGLSFMSITPFTGEHGVPLRGEDITNSIIELLAVTIWGALDYLIIHMPPGIGDELMDLIKYIPQCEIVVLSSPSVVSAKVVQRLMGLLEESNVSVAGVVVNETYPVDKKDQAGEGPAGSELQASFRNKLRGTIQFDPGLERAIGTPDRLIETDFAANVEKILNRILKGKPSPRSAIGERKAGS